jgi:hypothetical protein
VRDLSSRAGLPMPRVYLMDNPQPNAFATGRNPEHAAVAATTGLLDMLGPRELAGVIGHELTHIRNRDTLTMTVTATIAGAISMLAQFGGLLFGGRRGEPHPRHSRGDRRDLCLRPRHVTRRCADGKREPAKAGQDWRNEPGCRDAHILPQYRSKKARPFPGPCRHYNAVGAKWRTANPLRCTRISAMRRR